MPRAWLQCADTAKALQQTQLRLLVDNVTLPISPHKSLYSTVMDTACKALQALDCLVRGVPQQIDNGAVLLGLSSWHLYPDILMASTDTHIKQADNLIASGGIITIGLENKDGKFGGVFWSLPLAQAKYYGDPVLAKRCLGVEQSRVSFDELQLVIIGSIIRDWEDPSLQLENMVDFIQRLSIAVRRTQGKPVTGRLWYSTGKNQELDWLHCLGGTSEKYIRSKGITREHMNRLVALGKRRHFKFLGQRGSDHRPPPLFGLVSFEFLMKALSSPDVRVRFLSNWAHRELDPELLTDAVIIYNTHGKFEQARCTRLGERTSPSNKKRKTNQRAEVEHNLTWTLSADIDNDVEPILHSDETARFPDLFQIPPGPGERPTPHHLLCGDVYSTAIYVPVSRPAVISKNCLSIAQFFRCIEEGDFPVDRIETAIRLVSRDHAYREYIESLNAMAVAARIFQQLQGAQAHLAVMNTAVRKAHWWMELRSPNARVLESMFSCIAYFETGMYDINPDIIGDRTFAICHETSIFVAQSLLKDPSEAATEVAMERLVGNIGKPGLVFLVTPPNPRAKKVDYSSWHLVAHAPFSGVAEDNFQGTSMHLSFTGYELPLDLGRQGNHETPAYFLETAISVYDRGKWVTDVDIIDPNMWTHVDQSSCRHSREESDLGISRFQAVSIDSWIELLDPPASNAVVRAYRNPVARLAALGLALRQSSHVRLLASAPCWACTADLVKSWEEGLSKSVKSAGGQGSPENDAVVKPAEHEEDQDDDENMYSGILEDYDEDMSYAFNLPVVESSATLQKRPHTRSEPEASVSAGRMIFIY